MHLTLLSPTRMPRSNCCCRFRRISLPVWMHDCVKAVHMRMERLARDARTMHMHLTRLRSCFSIMAMVIHVPSDDKTACMRVGATAF